MQQSAFNFFPNHLTDGPESILLSQLLTPEFQGLAHAGAAQQLEPGTVLVVEGQDDTDLYFLLEGEVEVMAQMGQDWVRVAILGTGSPIGEMAFLDGMRRSARVITTTTCSVLQITRKSFEQFSQKAPNLALFFVLELSRIVSSRLRKLEKFDAAEEAKENERKTLAAELHDQTLAALGGMAIELGFLGYQVSEYSEELKSAVDNVRDKLKETDQQLRELVQGIYPPALATMGLVSAMNSHLGELATRPVPSPHSIEIKLTVTGFGRTRLKEELEIGLFRVIQQGVDNVIQHAQAKQVNIDLRWVDDEVTLVLTDDGVGFDVTNPNESALTGHFGLVNLQSRIERFLGRLQIESQPGKGTTLRANIPVFGAGPSTNESQVSTHFLASLPAP